MRPKKLSPQEMAIILQEITLGEKHSNICKKWDISVSTLYGIKKSYGISSESVIAAAEVSSRENALLRRKIELLEEDVNALQSLISNFFSSTEGRRQLIRWLISRNGLSMSRACRLVGMSRSLFLYSSSRSMINLDDVHPMGK